MYKTSQPTKMSFSSEVSDKCTTSQDLNNVSLLHKRPNRWPKRSFETKMKYKVKIKHHTGRRVSTVLISSPTRFSPGGIATKRIYFKENPNLPIKTTLKVSKRICIY